MPTFKQLRRRLYRYLRRDREYLERQLALDTILGFLVDCRVEGSYLEFGCARGSSLIDLFDSSKGHPSLNEMKFFVFDSFEGLPAPQGLDAGDFRRYEQGEFACDLDQYKINVRNGGVDLSRVTLTPGWYDKSLNDDLKRRLPIAKASLVLIDCDLYESTVPVLNFITDYIQDGTVLLFDDWFSYKGRLDQGEARAFTEWLTRNPSIQATPYHMIGRTMMSFIMRVG